MDNLMKLKATIVLAAFMVGCSAPKLTPAGEGVRITKEEPANCQNLGDVYGKGNSGLPSGNMEYARNDIRNETAQKGGNVVSLDSVVKSGAKIEIAGQAYKCP
jgi:hypothetical protein